MPEDAEKGLIESLVDTVTWTVGVIKPIVHVGFVPLVLYLGWRNAKPRPTLLQMISPL